MASGKKQGFLVIKNWIQNNQITFINTSATIVLIIIVIVFLLRQATDLQQQTAEESLENAAGKIATEVQTYFVTQYNTVQNIWQTMEDFEDIAPEQRRSILSNALNSGLKASDSLMNVFSIWNPNELDDMDASFANTENNDETGQYIGGYTRERGWQEQKIFPDYRFVLNQQYEEYFGYLLEIVSEPRSGVGHQGWQTQEEFKNLVAGQKSVWVVDFQIPVKDKTSTMANIKINGVIGATIKLEPLQILSEKTKPYHGSGLIFVCSNDGTIVAHKEPEMRGTKLFASEIENSPFSAADLGRIQETIRGSLEKMEPKRLITKSDLIVSYPFRATSTMARTRTNNARDNPPWALVTIVPLDTVLATINRLLKYSILFTIGAGIAMGFVVLGTSKSLTQKAKNLQHSLEQSTTMQDNLKYGLFLFDQKFIIQGAYSKALENILAVSDLKGKNFIELINSSIKETEQQGVMDYFEMVFKNAFDKEMLEGINPINEFTYVSTETNEVKSLRTGFVLAEQGKSAYILGTMEDITAEKELQKQLREAESHRENEMRSLFQVIQLDPRVLSDFVVDAEYEFERINEILKDKKQLRQGVLVEMYQSIHAIKSNALILNLEDFSGRLHKLESSIKELRERHKDVIPFDDFLTLVLELNDAMREIDKLKDTVLKIENFRNVSGGGDKNQEQYVLVETLSQVCKKTQDALDKKARFVVEEIDDVVLDYGPRRVIKEVLTQLVRNAVYHAIELPEKRESLGKEPEGEIRLSMIHRNGQIIIKLTDNGGGIDFGKIRKTALAAKLVRSADEANNKNYLLKALFSPGFSTLDSADVHAGRGVGLSLVKDRVKDLHGNITVTTGTGRGTTFTITLPLELPVASNAS
jgi:two-component system chemotaxis sensor kinase CheA